MANVAYDIPWKPFGLPIYPYVGAGAGYGWLDLGDASGNGFGRFPLPGNNTVSEPSHVTFGTAEAFAYQAIAGVAMPLGLVAGLDLTFEYRFFGTVAADVPVNRFGTGPGDIVNGVVPSAATHNGFALHDNAVLIGLRYSFGALPTPAPMAAPAAVPAPALQSAHSYLVFFDWDKATLTDRTRQIIKQAADNSTHVQYTRIEVNGYTDTSGTLQYSMGLSIRRANTVKAELIRDGVPAGEIATQGLGETLPLVPTGPGVREPQNRRVEIIIH